MRKYLLKICLVVICLILANENLLAAPRTRPRQVTCPVVGDLETGLATKSVRKYICFSTQAFARKNGFQDFKLGSGTISNGNSNAVIGPNVNTFNISTNFEGTSPAFIVSDISRPPRIDISYQGHRNFIVYLYNADNNRLISVLSRGNTNSSGPVYINNFGRFYVKLKIFTVATQPSGTLSAHLTQG